MHDPRGHSACFRTHVYALSSLRDITEHVVGFDTGERNFSPRKTLPLSRNLFLEHLANPIKDVYQCNPGREDMQTSLA